MKFNSENKYILGHPVNINNIVVFVFKKIEMSDTHPILAYLFFQNVKNHFPDLAGQRVTVVLVSFTQFTYRMGDRWSENPYNKDLNY